MADDLFPTWLINPDRFHADQPWYSFPKRLLRDWTFFWNEAGVDEPGSCVVRGCGKPTQVKMVRNPGGIEESRYVCSKEHALMIAAGEAD